MQYLYHVLSLREPVFIRPAELGGIQQVFFIKRPTHQPPDFFLRSGNLDIGVEVTEAVNEDYAKATTLPEANKHGAIIDPSLFKLGTSKKTLTELRSIVTRKKLTGPGWEGSSVEIEYANAILDKTLAKTKLLKTHYDKFTENWLLIYCNLTLPMLDVVEANQILTEKAIGYWSDDSFSKVFVEKNQNIHIYSRDLVKTLSLFDAWNKSKSKKSKAVC